MSLKNRLASGKFAVLAQMHTPKGVNISRLITDARRVKERVDAIVVPGMDNGIMRMSALAGGALMYQQGLGPIIHIYTRDRNRMALQGDILGAFVLGIENLVLVSGEEMGQGDHRDAATVNDISEVELIRAVKGLEQGTDMGGFELDGVPSFFLGCAIAPFADEAGMEEQLEEAQKKVAAGCQYVITPPIFNVETSGPFLSRLKELGVPVIATVFLIKSVAVARYIANSEPLAGITEDLIRRIRKSPDRENESILISGETIAALKKQVQGVLIQTLGWEHRIGAILDAAGL